jgi:hypothetical protein
MRGIGKGQTIALLIPPEVAKLIKMELILGRGVAQEEQPDLRSGVGEEDLRDVVAWLLINGMKSERTQANMLVCQNTANVWKKRAYRLLTQMSDKALLDNGGQSGQLSRLLTAWKEETDSTISNSIPLGSTLRATIDKRISDVKRIGLLSDPEDVKAIDSILKAEFASGQHSPTSDAKVDDSDDEASIEMEGEQVQEQEQEQVILLFSKYWLNSVFIVQTQCKTIYFSFRIQAYR